MTTSSPCKYLSIRPSSGSSSCYLANITIILAKSLISGPSNLTLGGILLLFVPAGTMNLFHGGSRMGSVARTSLRIY